MPSSGRFRSRSPGPRRGGGYGGGRGGGRYGGDDYDRRGPPRGYGDDRGYRERSPPPRRYDDDYDRRGEALTFRAAVASY
jgi:transcription initiation factor TFIID subunit 15